MTFVAAGSSLGTLVLPILLNNLLSRVGYGKMTLFSAALITFILVIACTLMRAPLPTLISKPPMMKSMRQNFKDFALIMISVGLVRFLGFVNSGTDSYYLYSRVAFFMIGFYYPFFYLQLDASKHGINETLTFYVVYITFFFLFFLIWQNSFFLGVVACYNECSEPGRTPLTRFFCSFSWCCAHNRRFSYLLHCSNIQYGSYWRFHERCGDRSFVRLRFRNKWVSKFCVQLPFHSVVPQM